MQCYLLSQKSRHLKVRVRKHFDISPLTRRESKSKKSTAVKDHMRFCDHISSIKNFKSLATSDSDLYVKVKESLLISCNKPIFKKKMKLHYLFTYVIDPSHMKLYFNDIYCYNIYRINITIVI